MNYENKNENSLTDCNRTHNSWKSMAKLPFMKCVNTH